MEIMPTCATDETHDLCPAAPNATEETLSPLRDVLRPYLLRCLQRECALGVVARVQRALGVCGRARAATDW